MARSHYVFEKGQIVYAVENGVVTIDLQEPTKEAAFYVIDDCKPFQSMIDGSIINSKSQYRNHLKEHGCVEIGNDSSLKKTSKPLSAPPGLKEQIAREVYAKLHY